MSTFRIAVEPVQRTQPAEGEITTVPAGTVNATTPVAPYPEHGNFPSDGIDGDYVRIPGLNGNPWGKTSDHSPSEAMSNKNSAQARR